MIKTPLKIVFCLILILFFCVSTTVSANNSGVVINEIAWMGTKNSYSDEWIELFNPNASSVSLDGWRIQTSDNKLDISLSGEIRANSYFLLERTDNNTLPSIKADQIYKGSLSNNGQKLFLIDNSSKNIIDEVDCSLGWFAGDNETKKTMERINPLLPGSNPDNWQTSQNIEGTPNKINSLKKEPKKQETIKTISSNYLDHSKFLSILIFGIVISIFFSMLIIAFWLKIRQKQGKVKNVK